jgi:hypothetical protein
MPTEKEHKKSANAVFKWKSAQRKAMLNSRGTQSALYEAMRTRMPTQAIPAAMQYLRDNDADKFRTTVAPLSTKKAEAGGHMRNVDKRSAQQSVEGWLTAARVAFNSVSGANKEYAAEQLKEFVDVYQDQYGREPSEEEAREALRLIKMRITGR